MYEEALKAHPTGRMYSLYAQYLQDSCVPQSSDPQAQDDELLQSHQATLQQVLNLYKRAFQHGRWQLQCLLNRVLSAACTPAADSSMCKTLLSYVVFLKTALWRVWLQQCTHEAITLG